MLQPFCLAAPGASPAQPPPGLLWGQQGRSHLGHGNLGVIWGIFQLSHPQGLQADLPRIPKRAPSCFPHTGAPFPSPCSVLTPYKSQHLRIAADKRFLMPQTLHTVILERRFHGSLQSAAILLDTAGTTGKGLQQSSLCFCPQTLRQFLGWTWTCKNLMKISSSLIR